MYPPVASGFGVSFFLKTQCCDDPRKIVGWPNMAMSHMVIILWMIAKSDRPPLDGWNPINDGMFFYLSTGAGFRNHPQLVLTYSYILPPLSHCIAIVGMSN